MFADDSIPAIYAVTDDPFIMFTSNIFAILRLRALYFMLAGYFAGLAYLTPALAAVLVFVGAKMLLVDLYTIPSLVSLAVIVGILGLAIAAALLVRRRTVAHGPRGERLATPDAERPVAAVPVQDLADR